MKFLSFLALCFISFFSSANSDWIKFEIINGKMVVPIKVEGQNVKAILDTSGEGHYISESFAKLGKLDARKTSPVIVEDNISEVYKPLYQQVGINVFGFDITLDEMQLAVLPEAEVKLGAGFFFNFVYQFDYPNKRLRLLDRKSVNLKKVKNIEMRAHRQTGLPIVKVGINNKEDAWFAMGTGLTEGLRITRSHAKSLGLTEQEVSKVEVADLNALREYDQVNLPEIKFGPFSLSNVKTIFYKDDTRYELYDNRARTGSRVKGVMVKGALGYDVLQHFVITVDFKNGYMHVGTSA
ncbi:aspartyl protease family protein [Pseudoalteromonas phenolica]|jgi:hypothetical protein|uniref:aspartyl protease family protein n=1 Tax=Pseudoalteromonas phenolica TaxID=161398 RepID=UPI00384B7832